MPVTDPIDQALELSKGARFYRCALQVNPFEYLHRYGLTTSFIDEAAYNEAIIRACLDNDIEVIAVTDHYRVRSGENLLKEARKAGIHAFPGFEAVTKDGVHLLCIFDQNVTVQGLERYLGNCGIHDLDAESPSGDHDIQEFLSKAHEWKAACVAAHVCANKGLLNTLSSQARVKAWKSPYLLACSLPGPVSNAPVKFKKILENKDPSYRRSHPVAILNTQDVNGPNDLAEAAASCWIKMSEVSVEGLRQAFLDPASRVRLASDSLPEEHTEFMAISWQGGFLDGAAIHFNENLNVLIGGKGTGKSTIIESLRYVLDLDPLGEDAQRAHEGVLSHVLRSGTKVSLQIRSHRPEKCEYRIERTVPNPPIVRNTSGEVCQLTPGDIIPQVEVYGQHEISELTRSRQKLTRLLERFVEYDPSLISRKREVRRELRRSRDRLLEVRQDLQQMEERMDALPALEEMLERYQSAGLEERLKERSLLVREEQVLKSIPERIASFWEVLGTLQNELPIDQTFLSEKALENLPGKEILSQANESLEDLSHKLKELTAQMVAILDEADQGLNTVENKWQERKKEVQERYENILRELQKDKVDGEEFINLRQQIEELRPLRARAASLRSEAETIQDHRINLLADWEDLKAEEFRQLERAAKRVSRRLGTYVRVQVSFAGNREPLFNLLRKDIGGRLAEAIEILKRQENLSLKELADACRGGREELIQRFGFSPGQAERLVQASSAVIMQIEELDLSPMTQVELNVAAAKQPPVWRALEQLSSGQKATAVLLLLLLESDAPLVVDQPEDDLDNRFITEGIVPRIREEKRRRQFVFSTHNANIPVLGDAELIVGLTAAGEPGEDSEGRAKISPESMGSIDAQSMKELVEELLEGGKDAFEMRRLKYGF